MSTVVKPGDFVVLKLDIDNELLEEMVMDWMRDNPRLRRLVSEMYFELHHDAKEMAQFMWELTFPYPKALKTFREFREMGVPLHSWP